MLEAVLMLTRCVQKTTTWHKTIHLAWTIRVRIRLPMLTLAPW